MIFLRTGLPGASKTLNSLREIILGHDASRQYFYNNIKLLLLDIDVCLSFSGWFYGWYLPRLKDKAMLKKLHKIMKPIHDNGEFLSLEDVPWLKPQFEGHDHFETWLYWVKKVYPKSKLVKLLTVLDAIPEGCQDKFEIVKPLNLHFTQFENPSEWMDLPKGSVILIDEVQQFFPPRSVGSRVPAAIGALETHRHGGYDIHFVTQDRTLCDANLRKLVGCHVHYYNALGGNRITRKEAPKCFNPNDYHESKNSAKKMIKRDSNFYGVYWSAEIHTHKFKVPAMAYFGLIAIGLIAYSLYSLSDRFFGSKPEVIPQAVAQPITEQQTTVVTNPLSTYIDELLTDVYITGSVTRHYQSGFDIEYSFARTTDDAVFYPDAIGLEVEDLGPCIANIKIADVVRPVTCNPFYIRQVVEDVEEEEIQDGSVLASTDSAKQYAPNIKLF